MTLALHPAMTKLGQLPSKVITVKVLDVHRKPVQGAVVALRGKSDQKDAQGNHFTIGTTRETDVEGIVSIDLGPDRPLTPLEVHVTDVRTPAQYLDTPIQKVDRFPADLTFYVFTEEDLRDRDISSGVVLTFGLAAGAACALGATKTKTETAVVCAIGAVLTGLGIWGLTKS